MKGLLAALAALSLTTAAASAQVAPGDLGLGTQRGIEQLNNSGQVGTVTLFRRGARTQVLVEVQGAPGRRQSVQIFRSQACDAITNKPVYFLADLRQGRSSTIVQAGEDRLLSGNYSVVVFSSNVAGAKMTACGHLYAS